MLSLPVICLSVAFIRTFGRNETSGCDVDVPFTLKYATQFEAYTTVLNHRV
jgi:hypothetical protein